MSQRIDFQAKTDTGLVRSNNEDNYVTVEEVGLCVVCDGLGGHAAGEVASEIATETMKARIKTSDGDPARRLKETLEEANRKILKDQQEHPERMGMGTTLSALWFYSEEEGEAWIAHIGDSRIYRYREEKLEQLTDDHSPLFRLYREGSISKDDLRHHPQKNLIERSLGLSLSLTMDVFSVDTQPADLFILCTDGLSDLISDQDLEGACRNTSWKSLAEKLVRMALDAGGHDNITVVAARRNF